jgi:IS30 family transposase
MTRENYNTGKHHLTLVQRGKLEEIFNREGWGLNRSRAARDLGTSRSTISRELDRNKVQQKRLDSRGFEEYYYIYDAEAAQALADGRHTTPISTTSKFDKSFWATLASELKKKFRTHSVDTWVHTFQLAHPEAKVPSTPTVYRYIDAGLVTGIINLDLPKKTGRRTKHNASKPKGKNKRHLGTSISQRPSTVLDRQTIGHWELDFVKGGRNKEHAALLTMTERKTRTELMIKVPDFTAETTLKYAKKLIRKHSDLPFLSITADNGSEFALLPKLRTNVYFAHAYSSWERGSNENLNGQIREFIPKGRMIEEYDDAYIERVEQSLNNKPRRQQGYQTPLQLLENEVRLKTLS